METETLQLQHERVDDIPLLLGVLQQLNMPELLERHLGSHHLHQGLSNGWLATVWLAFILSQSNHCKVHVQDWASKKQHTLEASIGQALRPVEFSDDRLSILLRRLHDADWEALEADLWQATCQVYVIPLDCVRLDSTTSYGYHTVKPEGILQFGHSKDHRSDLPQLKLMAAVAQPTSQCLACDLVPGQTADDVLYLPLIRRVQRQLGQHGLLYAGDCKMAALSIRAALVASKDYYLMPLARTGETAKDITGWLDAAFTNQKDALQYFYHETPAGDPELFGYGYEFSRDVVTTVDAQSVEWSERVQVIRSLALANRQAAALERRLVEAEQALRALTPPVGRGHQQQREEPVFQAALAAVLQQYEVAELLRVTWRREEQQREQYVGRGRGGPDRECRTVVAVRYQITSVERVPEAIELAQARLGWRVQVTNLPAAQKPLAACVELYNGGWSVERDFHLLKDQPLGIQPLYVREEEQIIGLTRLLTIALRVLTLIEIEIRGELEKNAEVLSGLYPGQPSRTTGYNWCEQLFVAGFA